MFDGILESVGDELGLILIVGRVLNVGKNDDNGVGWCVGGRVGSWVGKKVGLDVELGAMVGFLVGMLDSVGEKEGSTLGAQLTTNSSSLFTKSSKPVVIARRKASIWMAFSEEKSTPIVTRRHAFLVSHAE
jgi:hypothetical protein